MADKEHPPKAPTTQRRLFTLRKLKPFELPTAPDSTLPLRSQDPSDRPAPSAQDFAATALSEALAFLDHTWAMLADKGEKKSPPSAARVRAFAQGFNNPHGGREHWFARRSTHAPTEEVGTASWREFVRGIFDGHSVNEGEYTPDIFDTRLVVDWGTVEMGSGESGKWKDVSMQAYEMAHSMPFPLSNRVFPTLVIKATYTPFAPNKASFMIVQIPLFLESSPNSLYSTEGNREKGTTAEQKKTAIMGRYVSVERCTQKEDGGVLWEMATASDTEGSVPMPLQKLGVPGAIVKDVGLFMGWVGRKRGEWWKEGQS